MALFLESDDRARLLRNMGSIGLAPTRRADASDMDCASIFDRDVSASDGATGDTIDDAKFGWPFNPIDRVRLNRLPAHVTSPISAKHTAGSEFLLSRLQQRNAHNIRNGGITGVSPPRFRDSTYTASVVVPRGVVA